MLCRAVQACRMSTEGGEESPAGGRVGYVGWFLGCSREEFSIEKTYFRAYIAYMTGNPLCVDI